MPTTAWGRMVRKADRNGNITKYGYTFYDAPLYRRDQATGLEEVYCLLTAYEVIN